MKTIVKHVEEIPAEPVSAGTATLRQVLIGPNDAPNFALRKFIIEPGGSMPAHTNSVEHEQYVLSGHATIGIADDTFSVSKGDVVFIPAGVPHWYRTEGNEAFEFLCAVPNAPDTIEILTE